AVRRIRRPGPQRGGRLDHPALQRAADRPAVGTATGKPVVGGGSTVISVDGHGAVGSGATSTTTTTGKPAQTVKGVCIAGNVPLESWVELFRCFVNPASKLGLKALQLGVEFKLVAHDGQPLDPDHPTMKAM